MNGFWLLALLFVAVLLLIVAISKWKIHPFLAIMGISLLLAFFAGIELVDIPKIIGRGFSGIFSSIGIVIILGALIGLILEKTKAAMKLADVVVNVVGKKRPDIAMLIMGWIVSIPVFCDSGFVILNPIRKALCSKTKSSSVALTVALAGGLYVAHVFVPPTPGPIAAAGLLGIGDNLLQVIAFGIFVSIPCLIAAYIFAKAIGKKILAEDEAGEVQAKYEQIISSTNLPNGPLSFAPIVVPIIFMALGSLVSVFQLNGIWGTLLLFLGNPIIALALGLGFAVWLLQTQGLLKELSEITNQTLMVVGPILFITASGAVLGRVIAEAGFAKFITENASSLASVGIFFPFVVAAILKTAQGSSTVAITTTAGLLGMYSAGDSMMSALGLTSPLAATLVVMAIGAGAMTISHANDSYFWVVTKLGQISPENGYKTHTFNTFVMGVVGMLFVYILSLVLL